MIFELIFILPILRVRIVEKNNAAMVRLCRHCDDRQKAINRVLVGLTDAHQRSHNEAEEATDERAQSGFSIRESVTDNDEQLQQRRRGWRG